MFDISVITIKQNVAIWSFVMQGEKLKKPKYVYKTAEELIATGPTKRQLPEVTSELAKVKVIDMTGKEQRVLSGITNFSLLLAWREI